MLRAALVLLLSTAAFAQIPCPQIHADVPRVVSSTGHLHVADFDGDGNDDVMTDAYSTGISIRYGRGDGTFDSPVVVLAEITNQAAVVDFDGDGRPDILSVRDTLVLHVNLGHRAFAAPRVLRHLTRELFVAVGDFTNDGRPDIVMFAYGPDMNATTLVNEGDGRLTAVKFQAPISNVAAGDFDSDGNADLVSELSWGLTILYGDGHGTFGVRRNVLPQEGLPFVADLNGDRRDDIVAIRYDQNELLVTYGPIAATATPSARRFPAVRPGGLIPADYDRDGATDVAVLADGRISVYLNDRAGGLVTSDPLLGPPAASRFATGDFNRDGSLDLVVQAGAGFAVWPGRGDGTFRFPRTKLLPNAHLIGSADLDGDAVDELLVVRNSRLHAGRGQRDSREYTFEEVPVDIQTSFERHPFRSTPRLTGDHPVAATGGKLIAASGTFVRTFSRDATQSWREVASWDAGVAVSALTTANVDETDSAEEIAVVAPPIFWTYEDCRYSFQVRRTDGTMLSSADVPCTKNAAVHRSDIDSDGHVDLLVSGSGNWDPCGPPCGHGYAPRNDGYVLWFRGRGNGTFDPATPLVSMMQIMDVTLGDFNGDHHPDFVLTSLHEGLTVFHGDGAGGFRRTALRPAPSYAASAAGDVNGDGIDDLVLESDGTLTLFAGTPAGLVENGVYPGTDVPYIVRRGSRAAAVFYTLPRGEAGVIESDCRVGRRRIVRH